MRESNHMQSHHRRGASSRPCVPATAWEPCSGMVPLGGGLTCAAAPAPGCGDWESRAWGGGGSGHAARRGSRRGHDAQHHRATQRWAAAPGMGAAAAAAAAAAANRLFHSDLGGSRIREEKTLGSFRSLEVSSRAAELCEPPDLHASPSCVRDGRRARNACMAPCRAAPRRARLLVRSRHRLRLTCDQGSTLSS